MYREFALPLLSHNRLCRMWSLALTKIMVMRLVVESRNDEFDQLDHSYVLLLMDFI